ncbi:18227_t:CDS:2, partial [Acaulospora morrowiae]
VSLKDYGICERLQDMPTEMLKSASEILRALNEDDETNIEIRDYDSLKFAGLGITTHSNITDDAEDDKNVVNNDENDNGVHNVIGNNGIIIPAKTPLEKLVCVKRAVQEIATISDTYLTQLAAPKAINNETKRSPITTDDFIPLLAYVIVNSKIRKLESILFYMQTFRLSKVERSELSFALTTLRASTEFLKSDPLQLHDSVSTTSSISSISSHSSYKYSSPTLPINNRVRSRATSFSSLSTPISSPPISSIYPSSQVNHSKSSSMPGLVQQPSPTLKRDDSLVGSTNSGFASPKNRYGCKHNPGDESMTTNSGRPSFDLANSASMSTQSSTNDIGNFNPHQRRRRASITPVLLIKPQILLAPRNAQSRKSLDSERGGHINHGGGGNGESEIPNSLMNGVEEEVNIGNNRSDSYDGRDRIGKLPPLATKNSSYQSTSRSNSSTTRSSDGSGKPKNWRHSIHAPEIIAVIPRHAHNGTVHTGKPILDLSPPNPEILGDFLSSLQSIDGEVSGNRNEGFTARRW